jgi:hypothetical protein
MKAANWDWIFYSAASFMASSDDIGVKQALELALKFYSLFDGESFEHDEDDEPDESD